MPDTEGAPLVTGAVVNGVLVGDDGFLFFHHEGLIQQLCGDANLPPDDVARWAALIEARTAWCQSMGIHHVMLIVPEKYSVYGDKLPDGLAPSPQRPALQVMRALDDLACASYCYPAEVLIRGRSVAETYFRADVHPSHYGSYLCYRELVAAIPEMVGRPPIPEEALDRRTYQKLGDLAVRLDTEPVEEVVNFTTVLTRSARRVYTNRGWGPGHVEVFENDDFSLPRCVLFRDSSATGFLPFLATHFARVVAVATRTFHYDLVRSERPLVAVTEMTERLLGRRITHGDARGEIDLPPDFGPQDFPTATGLGLPLPTYTALAIGFGQGRNDERYLREGWSPPDRHHRWTIDHESIIEIPWADLRDVAPGEDLELEFEVFGAMLNGRTEPHRLRVEREGLELASFAVSRNAVLRCPLPAEGVFGTAAGVRLTLVHPDAVPVGGADPRRVSIALLNLRVYKVQPSAAGA